MKFNFKISLLFMKSSALKVDIEGLHSVCALSAVDPLFIYFYNFHAFIPSTF